jgi:hypothetical protein
LQKLAVSHPPDPPLTRATLLGLGTVLALTTCALRKYLPTSLTEAQCITMLTVLTLGVSCFVGCFQRGTHRTRWLCGVALLLCTAIAVEPVLWLWKVWGN